MLALSLSLSLAANVICCCCFCYHFFFFFFSFLFISYCFFAAHSKIGMLAHEFFFRENNTGTQKRSSFVYFVCYFSHYIPFTAIEIFSHSAPIVQFTRIRLVFKHWCDVNAFIYLVCACEVQVANKLCMGCVWVWLALSASSRILALASMNVDRCFITNHPFCRCTWNNLMTFIFHISL